jgi:hypothetical protein
MDKKSGKAGLPIWLNLLGKNGSGQLMRVFAGP